MIWLFLNKFVIFLVYYIGITAFVFVLHMNNVIYLFEENILFKSLAPAKPLVNTNYDYIIGEYGVPMRLQPFAAKTSSFVI